MRKVNAKTVLKRAKAQSARKWTYVGYSIDSGVLAAFKRVCKKHGVTGSHAVEEFMREFNKLR